MGNPSTFEYPHLAVRGRYLILGLACLHLLGCALLVRDVRKGDALAKEGRWREALATYEAASEAHPGLPGLPARVARARKALARSLVRDVAPSLSLGRLEKADALFHEAVELDPTVPEAPTLRATLARAWLDRVSQATGEDAARRAFVAAEKARALDPEGSDVQSVYAAALHAYTADLLRQAERFRREGRAGNALAALLRLQELAPDRDLHAPIEDARAALRDQTAFRVEVHLSGDTGSRAAIARRLLDALEDLEDSATCPDLEVTRIALSGPGIRLGLSLDRWGIASHRKVEVEPRTYVVGSRKVKNPAYAEARAEVARRKKALDEAVGELKARLQAVSAEEVRYAEAPPDADMDSLAKDLAQARQVAKGARQAAEEAARALADARRRLADTPKRIDQPIEKTSPLTITQVTRRAELAVRVAARALDQETLLLEPTRLEEHAETQDVTHPALPRAKIEADPLSFPQDDATLEETVLSAMSRRISKQVLELCKASRAALRDAPNALPPEASLEERTEAWMAALIRRDGDVPQEARDFFAEAWGLTHLPAPLKVPARPGS